MHESKESHENSPKTHEKHTKGLNTLTLFEGLDPETARIYSLVLTSRHIPHVLERERDGAFSILVNESVAKQAFKEIRLYNRENLDFSHEKGHKPRQFRKIKSSLLSVVFVACVMSLTFRYEVRDILLEVGAADSSRIVQGEIWRTVTALFLHADPSHFFSNVFMAGLFFTILFEETGVGMGWFLVIIGGAAGNYLNALMYGYGHVSIGLSTSIFSSIGTYCSIRAMEYGFSGLREGFKVLLSGLALLGILGTGQGRVDILAHFYGFFCGLFLGGLVVLFRRMVPWNLSQKDIFFAALTIFMVSVSWVLAITKSWVP